MATGTTAAPILDAISISDRMSSSSSLFVPPHLRKTTIISTIAVQCCGSRMVIALLQSKDALNLRVLEMTPSLTALGKNVEESSRFLNEHINVLEKLRNNQTPVEEYFRKANNLVPNQIQNPELYAAMGDCLGQAWRDLLSNLELRKEILNLGKVFHGHRMESLENFKITGANLTTADKHNSLQMYTIALEAGRKLLGKLDTVEDSYESVAHVNEWLQDLVTKLQEWKDVNKKRDAENKLIENFEELKRELDDITQIQNLESKRQKLVALLAKINNNTLPLIPDNKSWLESKIYSQMGELNVITEGVSNVNEFLSEMKQLHLPNFKDKYFEKLKIVRYLDTELTSIIKRRLGIREDYEEILQNILGYSEDEVIQKLSQDKDLDINGAIENIRLERQKQEVELFQLFKDEIQNFEMMKKNGEFERVLSGITNLTSQLENSPEFQRKNELILWCTRLRDETLEQIRILENVSKFVNSYRELAEDHFTIEHNAIYKELERIDGLDFSLGRIVKSRMSVRRSYEDILRNPTQFEDDEIVELLTRDETLDANSAITNIRNEKKLQEMFQTLDFPLPENLETARNDLEDFKSFEEIIKSLPHSNTLEELIEKNIIKKKKIVKCIEFYELVESIERTKHIKHISHLEIELFGTTHMSESIYEEKINQMEQLRQMEIAETQRMRVEKPNIIDIEVQTESELFPFIQERPHTPPPLLIESNTQTGNLEPLQLQNSETQTAKIQSTFSATQTNLELVPSKSHPVAASIETQTIEIPPKIVYLIPEKAPVKLRNNQTQTQISEEPIKTEIIKKRSQILIEEDFEEFESRRTEIDIGRNKENPITIPMSTQTDIVPIKLSPEVDDDTILVKKSDMASVAKLLLNTECQTEKVSITDQNLQRKPLDIVIPPEITFALAHSPRYSKLVQPQPNEDKLFQSCHKQQESINAIMQTTIIERTEYNPEETKLEVITPQLSVRERAKSWQIPTTSIEHKKEFSIAEEKKLNTGYYKPEMNGQSIANYRMLFQSPISNIHSEETQLSRQEKPTIAVLDDELGGKRSVAIYRKMFQALEESKSSKIWKSGNKISDGFTIYPKPQVNYWKPREKEIPKPVREIEDLDRYRVTEESRERTLTMYRKLMHGHNQEHQGQVKRSGEEFVVKKREMSAPPDYLHAAAVQPLFEMIDYKSPGFGVSQESLDGICCSPSPSASERSYPTGQVSQIVNKYNTLPIRPSKFIPKEFQESDYESDYDYKIPSMWFPPGGRPPKSLRTVPADYRSRSVPPSDLGFKPSSTIYQSESQSQYAYANDATNKDSIIGKPAVAIPEQFYYPPNQQSQKTKPIPPPKPRSRQPSPAFQHVSEEVLTSLKSEMTKREEMTKFILAAPKIFKENYSDNLKVKKQPEYYVSVTSPPIVVPKKEMVTTKRSYESHEEYLEERTETNFGRPSKEFQKREIEMSSPSSITTFFTPKELTHPILYELEDNNNLSDSEKADGVELQSYSLENTSRVNIRPKFDNEFTINRNKYSEIPRFTPSKFIPMMTSEEEFSSTEEEFIVKPKWKPLDHKDLDKSTFRPVKGPNKPEKPKVTDPGVFYIACDFSLECGFVENQK